MKYLITTDNGEIVSVDHVIDSDYFLTNAIHLIHCKQPSGASSNIFLTRDGMLLIYLQGSISGDFQIYVPTYTVLDEMCSDQTYRYSGQAFMIKDLILRYGYATTKTVGSLVRKVASNIRDMRFKVILSDE